MKFKTKRFLSRLLAFVTITTSAIQSVPALSAESGVEKSPSYETVKKFLDAEEVVTAKDPVYSADVTLIEDIIMGGY